MTTFYFHRRMHWTPALLIVAMVGSLLPRPVGAQPAAPARAADDEQVFQAGDDQGAAAPAEMKHVAVVAAANYDDLMADINFIGGLVGHPDIAASVEGTLAGLTGDKELSGVDKTKPWGLIVQTDGMQFLPVVCVPVTDSDRVLQAVTALGGEVQDEPGGMKRLAMLDGNAVFAKNEAGWSFLARDKASLSRVPKQPQDAFSRLLADYDVALRASAQNVPPMYKQLAILTLQSAMQQQMQRQANETDEEYAARRQAVQSQMDQTIQQIKDIDTLSLGWSIDRPKKRSVMEFAYSFVPGSKMAGQIAAYGQPKTNFAGFYQPDAAATARFASQADPKAIAKELAQFQTMMKGARSQFNTAVDESEEIPDEATREALKAAGADWFDAFEATLLAGIMDGGAALRVSPDSLTFVAGVAVKEPDKIESGIKKLEAGYQQSPSAPPIKWNAANHDGVRFHTMSVPLEKQEDNVAKLLGGKADIAFGIGPQAVYLAVGKDNLAAVEKAIDASKAEPNKSVPPLELNVSLLPIMETVAARATDARDRSQAVVDVLRQQPAGSDRLRVTGQIIPNGLKYRIEAEEGVLRAIGAAAQTAQQQAAAQ